MTLIEAIAAALVVIAVVLVAWRSVWNYPVAILAVAIYAIVFARVRLYSDMTLQGFFLAANMYGWIGWTRAQEAMGTIAVDTLDTNGRLLWGGGIVVSAALWGTAMHAFTDASYPWWDAGIAAASVAAQLLQARRAIESWWLWIAVDAASIPLYAVKALWFTTALYVLLLGIAVFGFLAWRRTMTMMREPLPA